MSSPVSTAFFYARHAIPVAAIAIASVWTSARIVDLGYGLGLHLSMIAACTFTTLFVMAQVHDLLRDDARVEPMLETIVVSSGAAAQILLGGLYLQGVSSPIGTVMAGWSANGGEEGRRTAEVVVAIASYGQAYLTVTAFVGIISILLCVAAVASRKTPTKA